MKRFLILLCAMAALLGGTALADSGPKPQLIVKVVNGPAEPYYLDLLEEGAGKNGLSQEALDALDQEMLSGLLDAVPEGWRACVTQGTGVPIFGKLTGENGIHTFGYFGVPDTYRVLIVTQSGEVWTSELLQRKVLQSSVTVDWAAGTARTPPVWVGYALQFLSTLLPTLVLEGIVLLLFRFDWKENWKPFLVVNLITQGAFSLFLSVNSIQNGVGFWYFVLFIPAELVIAFAEAGIYTKVLRGASRGRAFAYGLTANAASAAAGWILLVPIWRWIVSIS